MKLNELNVKIVKKKVRVGRGIGSGKGKTSGRGHKGQKSRSGVAIKSFEGGQMPLYRRLPKRGFKPIKSQKIGILNLSQIDQFINNNKINSTDLIDINYLKKNKVLGKKFKKLKILGTGEVKNKISLKANYFSLSAKEKIEKNGGKILFEK